MKNRHYATLFKLMAISLLVASCQPEPLMPEGMLRVSTETLAQRGKAVVNGTASTWQDGDQIRFSNGTLATVSVVDCNYYISQSGIASGTAAVYPASIVKDAGAGAWTLTLPDAESLCVGLVVLSCCNRSGGLLSPLSMCRLRMMPVWRRCFDRV